MAEEEIQTYRQQLCARERVAFDATKIIVKKLCPKKKRKILQWPSTKQEQLPTTQELKYVKIVNSGGNKQQFLAYRAENSNDFGENGIF